MNDTLLCADARDFIEQHINVFLTTENGTQRPCDLIVRKQSGRNLVQHGAKEVVIPFINQRNTDWSVAQSTGCGESSEAATDNDHTRQHQLQPPSRATSHEMRHDNALISWPAAIF